MMAQTCVDTKTVLVVDDDASGRRGIERLLRVHGFNVEGFDSSEDFLARANPRAAVCVVLDIHLTGMSGIELSRQLALSGNLLPVIFITANDSDATRKAAENAGCVAYLLKPFSSRVLLETIDQLPDRRRADNESI